ncbi:MAG: hypothetical protein J7518_02985 [Nocardioidaceae bacterium]|nr:hypothetical protein [Nocardioidaceae bacterium]
MVVGLLLAGAVRSPAQQALDTRAPARLLITAPVTTQKATAPLTVRGTVDVGQEVAVGPIQASTALSIVTGVFVKPGTVVKPGDRLIEVSGRPVLLLRGRFGAYRDLRVGDRGPDAAQVNRALVGLGLPAPRGASFTAASAAALTLLYARYGYAPPAGGRLDRREVAFVPDKTALVTAVAAAVGGNAKAPNLVALSSGTTLVTANLDPSSARTIRRGNKATIDLDDAEDPVPAVVSAVVIGADLSSTRIELTPSTPISAAHNGVDVRVEIEASLGGQGMLAVPVTAIFSQADGRTVVVKVDGSARRTIPVRVGSTIGGFAAVVPTDPAGRAEPLRAGDQVEVSGPGVG